MRRSAASPPHGPYASKQMSRYERVVVFLDARMKADLARAIAQLMGQVIDALGVMLVGHV